jgi:Dyp-type peroxidase family
MRANVRSIELGGVANLAVLAPIKAGFVPGFETITYLDRLRRLLKAMHAARQNVRESELHKPVFPDPIGRSGIIHSFRYAIVPPYPLTAGADEPGTSRLSLNVSFDGGWEPYMRVIYRDIGTLLDALFCHCVGYPGSLKADFDTYCRWVRDNEVDGGIFYNDSTPSLGDQRYLGEVERLQRETPDRKEADAAIARFALESDAQQLARALAAVQADPKSTLALPLRTLKGLYRLAPFFPNNADGDDGVLIRFAQSALKEFRQVIANPKLKDSEIGRLAQTLLAAELAWLASDKTPPSPKTRQLDYSEAALQSAMLARDDPVTHGCVVMLGVRSAGAAATHLAEIAGLCGVPDSPAQVRHHVAFTHAGLAALGIAPERLDLLPQEFVEGMEARCGLLGDVRGNHPDRWLRPLRHAATPADERIDLTAVHVVVVLRLIDPDALAAPELHPRLEQAVAALQAAGSGLTVLALQPTRSYRDDAGQTAGHFGFADGLSQPTVAPAAPGKAPAPGRDTVAAGEFLLGHRNDRGDGPFPAQADDFLDNGSFLVMRKLRQRVDHIEAALGAHPAKADVLARMMGRRQDGAALVPLAKGAGPNEFDYDADPAGAACPFHSHVRRANPRDGRQHLPRILRRGMSYGPQSTTDLASERGVVFMAYCASIAEQFETIQRWIAGGNSSGVSSSQADPFLAVPQPGEKRTFRYLDAAGEVARADLGDKPFVQLEWGLYLFVPSLKALRLLAEFRQPPALLIADPEEPMQTEPLEIWRRRLEDPDRSKAAWQRVREQAGGGLKAPPYGTLLGTQARVLEVLKDDGTDYSVQGCGQRMTASIGLNHLGMDPTGGHSRLGTPINAAIESIDMRKAFAAALPRVKKALDGFGLLKQPDPTGPVRVPVDLISLSESVLAGLCTEWVGLPEEMKNVPKGEARFMIPGGRVDGDTRPPRCPGHLLTASRYTFAPHPRPDVLRDGPPQGQAVLQAVEALLASKRPRGTLTIDIQDRLERIKAEPAEITRAIAGVLLGFPPTVHGNFLRTMETWIDDKVLWACQQQLADVSDSITDPFDRAHQALLKPLFKTMRERPIPEMLWRCPVEGGQVVLDDDKRVVLGIASALTDPDASDMLMFGGSRSTSDDPEAIKTLHACPGYEMGTGVLLALIAGLLDAGTLRPTGSPVLLMLTPRVS